MGLLLLLLHLLVPGSLPGFLLLLSSGSVSCTGIWQDNWQPDSHLAQYNHRITSSSFGEPVFRLEPPSVINFDSSRGATILCLASGSPQPTITWYTTSSSSDAATDLLSPLEVGGGAVDSSTAFAALKPIGNVTGLRQIINNGAAVRLLPFKGTDFRPDIHSTEYRCTASNNLATIHSRSCLVQAVDPEEPFEVKVADEFVALGETAVLKCRAQGLSQELGQLEEWTTSDGLRFLPGSASGHQLKTASSSDKEPALIMQHHKFVAWPTGELHLSQVEMADLRRSYGCRWRNTVTGVSVHSSGLAQLILISEGAQETHKSSSVAHAMGSNRGGLLHSVNQLIVEEEQQQGASLASSPPALLIPCATRQLPKDTRVSWLFQAPSMPQPKPIEQLAVDLGRRVARWQGATYLALDGPPLPGRYLCQLNQETLCDTTVIVRQPLRLKIVQQHPSAALDSPWQESVPNNNNNNNKPQPSTTSLLGRAFGSWFGASSYQQEEPHTPEQALGSAPRLVRAHGPGLVRGPAVLALGQPLRLECQAQGQPLEQVRWFLNGRPINVQLAAELQADISDPWPHKDHRLNGSSSFHQQKQQDSYRLVSVLQVRQLQAPQAGLQVFECQAQNSLGDRARADLVVFVAEWALLHWSANQCLLHHLNDSSGNAGPPPPSQDMALGWMSATEAGGEHSAGAASSIFRRLNPLRQALLIEGEPVWLECPRESNPRHSQQMPVEWRRRLVSWSTDVETTRRATIGDQPSPAATQALQRNFNQLFMGDSRFVINGASLQIRSPSKRHDEALYVCRASAAPMASSEQLYPSSSGPTCTGDRPSEWAGAAAEQVSSSISIRIVAKPKIDPFEFSRTLEEGQRTWAVCGVSSGEAPIEITWFKDGQLLVADAVTTSIELAANRFSSTLTFHHIRPAHSGLYTCVAANSFASTNHSSRLLVNVAPYFVEPPQSRRALLGSSVLINCRAAGEPSPQIRWRKLVGPTGSSSQQQQQQALLTQEGAALNQETPTVYQKQLEPVAQAVSGGKQEFRIVTSNSHIQILENGSMLIRDLELGDGSRYLCQASNGINPSLSEMVELTVLSPPQFELNYETVSVKRDATIKFNCAPRGDQPMRIRWLKEMQPLLRSTSSSSTSSRSGPQPSRSSTKYTELLHLLSTSGDAPLQHYNLFAAASAVSPTSTLQPLQSSHSPAAVGERLSELLISYADRSDTGAFVCEASNAHGSDRITYRLTVQEPPDQPTRLRAEAVQANSLKLAWLAPFDGNLALSHFVVEYRRMSELRRGTAASGAGYPANTASTAEWMRFVTPVQSRPMASQLIFAGSGAGNLSEEQGTVLRQLEPRTPYQVRVAALNALGQGAFSAPLVVSTLEEPPVTRVSDLRAQPLSSSSIKVAWEAPSSIEEQAPITGYHVRYRKYEAAQKEQQQQQQQSWLGTSSISATNVTRSSTPPSTNPQAPAPPGVYELLINGLERSTRYEISVQPYNGMGMGPSVETLGQTLKFDRPGQPSLRLVSAKRQSLELKWQLPAEDQQPVLGFALFYKCEYDDWLKIQLGLVYHYIIEGLRCGNRYQVYLSAFNGVGVSEASEVISARTEGTAPIAPDKSRFLRANTSQVQLDVVSWQSGGCPITSFMVQFKRLHDSNWFILTEGATPFANSDKITIPDLAPATWYKLLVSVLNEAGSTNAEYLFSTLDSEGHPIAPLAGGGGSGSGTLVDFSSQWGVDDETRGGSMLNQLLSLARFPSSAHSSADRSLLVPLSCLLLLLISSLLSYLYYTSRTSGAASSRQQESSAHQVNNHKRCQIQEQVKQKTSSSTVDELQADGQLMRMLLAGDATHQHHVPIMNLRHDSSSCMMDSFEGQLQEQSTINLCPSVKPDGSLVRKHHSSSNNYNAHSSSMSTHSTVFDPTSGSSAPSSSSNGATGIRLTTQADQCSPQSQLLQSSSDTPTQAFMLQQQQPHTNCHGSPPHTGNLYSTDYSAPDNTHLCQQTTHLSPMDTSGLPEFQAPQQRFHQSASFASAAELMQRQAANIYLHNNLQNHQATPTTTTTTNGSQYQADSIYQRLDNFQPAYGLMGLNKHLSSQLMGRSHTLKYGSSGLVNNHVPSISSFDDQELRIRSLHFSPQQQHLLIPNQDCPSIQQASLSPPPLVQPPVEELPLQQQSHVMCIGPRLD